MKLYKNYHSMFNIITSLLKKLRPNQSAENNPANFIYFRIDPDTEHTDIFIDIQNISKNNAQKLGNVLFLLNEGYYVQSFLDIINQLSKSESDINKTKFLKQIIDVWASKVLEANTIEENNTKDSPIIKPTCFHKNS